MGFVGVTTGSSSIRSVFPRWAHHLDLPTDRLIGHDLPLGAPPAAYRDVVSRIAGDPLHWGALVTTHKMAVFEHARDLFDEVDELAERFAEISSVSKRGGRLVGRAKDPITVRLALQEIVPENHFTNTGAAALVLGSGGAGCALSHELGVRADRPSQIICTAVDLRSLDHVRELHERAGIAPDAMRYVLTSSPRDADELVAELAPGSLVANATGMGKDLPGSPVSNDVDYPDHAHVWEFNYRGSLEFLCQASALAGVKSLAVHDGWRYFVHGWSQVVAEVFAIPMPPETVDELAAIAGQTRS